MYFQEAQHAVVASRDLNDIGGDAKHKHHASDNCQQGEETRTAYRYLYVQLHTRCRQSLCREKAKQSQTSGCFSTVRKFSIEGVIQIVIACLG